MSKKEGTVEVSNIIESEFEVVELTREIFFEEIIFSKKPVLIDFSGQHCGPCKPLEPVFKKLNAEFGDRLLFAHLECSNPPEIVKHFNVRGIPTLLFLKPEGFFPKVIKTKVGFLGEQDLREAVVQFLSEMKK